MALSKFSKDTGDSSLADFDLQKEIEKIEKSLRDINLLIEQSQNEVKKLSQRNAAITAHLQQIQSHLHETTPEEIRMTYDSALEAQQRLLVMRGQLEKLQSDREHLLSQQQLLLHLQEALLAGTGQDNTQKDMFASVEMLINAQEAERQRLSRQMHDGPAQALSNFILQTEIAARLLDMDVEKARVELDNLKTTAMKTFQEVRTFIFELRPMMLDDLGLLPTVKRYIENFREQTGLNISLSTQGDERRLAAYLEVLIFRAIQELLDNALRHSGASQVRVRIDLHDEQIRISVEDDGRGFNTDEFEHSNNLGLKLIRDRVEMLGGQFSLDSEPGKGVQVAFMLPALPYEG